MGSGFGAQGSGQLFLGTLPASVSTWNDTQIIASVAPGAASGAAQVLQNGTLSNAVNFTVNNPHIGSVTPNFGSAGTTVTISGSGFGASQGSGIAWIGSTQGLASSWSDNQVQAAVDASAVSGIVRIQQNGVWSNALTFKVPPSLSTDPSVTINPGLVSMVVGETRTLQAVDDSGQPLTGLTWASSDATVATLSTDDPPLITAVASGHVTITAGSGSADLTIYPGPTLPVGTVAWSVPGDGSGVLKILPAVPSDSGADVFSLQESGTVQALTAEGKMLWASSVGPDKTLIPDFQGGLEVADSQSLTKLDALTGRPYPSYNFANPNGLVPPILVNIDGTVLTVDGDSVVGIDPVTGLPRFSIQLEHSIFSNNGDCGEFTPGEFSSPPDFGQPIIAGDGYAYFPYSYRTSPLTLNNKFCFAIQNPTDGDVLESEFVHIEDHSRVLRVAPDGSSLKVAIGDWTFDSVHECVYAIDPPYNTGAECFHTRDVFSSSGAIPSGLLGTLITNADQGVHYSWDLGLNDTVTHQLTTVDSAANVSTASLPLPGSFTPVLQQEDGSFVGTVSIPPDPSGEGGAQLMVATNASGIPKWSIPNYSPEYAQIDGSTIAASQDGLSTITLDQSGTPTGFLTLRTPSWTGQAYDANLEAASIAIPPLQLAGTFAALAGGNHSGSAVAIQQVLTNQQQTAEKQLPNLSSVECSVTHFSLGAPAFPTCGNINAIELLTNQSPDSIFQAYLQTFRPVIIDPTKNQANNDVMIFSTPGGNPINITAPNQKIDIALEGVARFGQGPFSVLVERVDPINHVIAVVTLKGHPLAGWRYWRVYSISTNDVVIETGAYDQPGPGPKNYVGYFIATSKVSTGWKHFLQFIQNDLHASQGSQLNHLGGQPRTIPQSELLEGFWDIDGEYTGYILNNVCQASSCN